jgi:hypothetical protein
MELATNTQNFTNISDEVYKLTYNNPLKSLFKSFGLDVLNVSWEDTARSKNSCWGPNISDMTLCLSNGRCMPVIRKPNFADVSTDFPIEKLSVVVGNENGTTLKKISLKEYLQNINVYTKSIVEPMYKERDEKILTSSQCCILPVEVNKVDFSVQLYNYQTNVNNPKVLVIVSSSAGTSCQILKGTTKLHFNEADLAYHFRVQRLEDDRKERKVATTGKITSEEKQNNVLFIYQIPLKDQEDYNKGVMRGGGSIQGSSSGVFLQNSSMPMYAGACAGAGASWNYGTKKSLEYKQEEEEEECGGAGGLFGDDDDDNWGSSAPESASTMYNMVAESASISRGVAKLAPKKRGFDHGIISKGDKIGSYDSVGTRKLVRDDSYPIRLTIQHYRVTDTLTGINSELVKEISDDINNIYSMGDTVSSLVVEGNTKRVTEPQLQSQQPIPFFNFS